MISIGIRKILFRVFHELSEFKQRIGDDEYKYIRNKQHCQSHIEGVECTVNQHHHYSTHILVVNLLYEGVPWSIVL
jgi:hypothetical protein